jgi:hypothetical protein
MGERFLCGRAEEVRIASGINDNKERKGLLV